MNYWTDEIQKSIIEYKQTNNEQLFTNIIYPAFKKLAEYWAGSFKLDVPSDEVITHLWLQIHKYKEGGNSFAFFGTCAKFYLYGEKKKLIKKEAVFPMTQDDVDFKNRIDSSPSHPVIIFKIKENNNLSSGQIIELNNMIEKIQSIPTLNTVSRSIFDSSMSKHIFTKKSSKRLFIENVIYSINVV